MPLNRSVSFFDSGSGRRMSDVRANRTPTTARHYDNHGVEHVSTRSASQWDDVPSDAELGYSSIRSISGRPQYPHDSNHRRPSTAQTSTRRPSQSYESVNPGRRGSTRQNSVATYEDMTQSSRQYPPTSYGNTYSTSGRSNSQYRRSSTRGRESLDSYNSNSRRRSSQSQSQSQSFTASQFTRRDQSRSPERRNGYDDFGSSRSHYRER